jgi:hypothetical protein
MAATKPKDAKPKKPRHPTAPGADVDLLVMSYAGG